MSAARMDYEFAGWKANTDAINDHAARIDEMAARLDSQARRLELHSRLIGGLQQRVGELEKAKDVAETHADLMEALDKPKPMSWGERMRKEFSHQRSEAALYGRPWQVDCSAEIALIAEAEAAMKPEWRPMATAPRDGRWVLLRRGSEPRHFMVARAVLDRCWESATRFTNTDQAEGWLPIPGEDAP